MRHNVKYYPIRYMREGSMSKYLTVTVKREVAERARERVGHEGVRSLSDFVEQAITEKLATQEARANP